MDTRGHPTVPGHPDKLITNPDLRSAGKMRLYPISRVETVEATPEWEAWTVTNARRSDAHTRGGPTADAPAPPAAGRAPTGSAEPLPAPLIR